VKLTRSDELLRRLCGIPGVGLVTAVTFKAAIDDPRRFGKSKTVGAHFGLTPKRLQSGTSVDVDGHISRRVDGDVPTALYGAASVMLTRSKRQSAFKAWGTQLAAKRGHKRAVVAVARKLAVIMHRMWINGTTFRVSATDRDGERRIGTAAAVAHAA
jgi:transposase